MKVHVEPLTVEHVSLAASDIRRADLMEWLAVLGETPAEHLAAGDWYFARCALSEAGEPLCMWGTERDGSVWLVATNKAVPVALSIHRCLREEFQMLLEVAPEPHCWADSRNILHHKWLEWLGFEEVDEAPYGPLGLYFKLFTLKGA